MKRYNFLFYSTSILIFIFDQVTKLWALHRLDGRVPINILPFLNFTLVQNKGIAFGLFHNGGDFKKYILLLFTLLAIFFLIFIFYKQKECTIKKTIIIAMIFGGALGNIYDRIFRGFVVDFIDVYLHKYHWPVFNIADSFVTIGLLAIFYYQILKKEDIL